jgi:hypothetical protein
MKYKIEVDSDILSSKYETKSYEMMLSIVKECYDNHNFDVKIFEFNDQERLVGFEHYRPKAFPKLTHKI